MKIEKVNCLVTLSNDGNESIITQIPMSGPSAISVTEIPLIQAQNGPDSVTRVYSAGFFETDKRNEISRLEEIYESDVLKVVYPGQHAPLPKTIADIDLPDKHIFDAPVRPVEDVTVTEDTDTSKDDEIASLKAQLAESNKAASDLSSELTEMQNAAEPPAGGGEPLTKGEWRAALKEAGVDVPIGNHGIPALKAMMPEVVV